MLLRPSVQKSSISLLTSSPFGHAPLTPNPGSLPVDIISLIQSLLTIVMLVHFDGSCAVVTILHHPPPSWSANEPILDPSRKFLFAPSCPALFDLDLQIATQYFAEISGWFQDHHRLEAFLHSHSYLRHPSAHFSCDLFTGNSDITPTGQQLAMFQILSPSCISIPSAHMAKLAPIF